MGCFLLDTFFLIIYYRKIYMQYMMLILKNGIAIGCMLLKEKGTHDTLF
jgi:hypothetical protein